MKLFKTSKGNILKSNGKNVLLSKDWNELTSGDNLFEYLSKQEAIVSV